MSEAPLMNDEAARSPAGEILDQSAVTTQTSTTETGSDPAKTQDSPAPSTETKDGTSVLTKPADDKAPKPDAPKAPDTYADFKAPEGYTLDPKAIESALPIFKELGLTQDQAQRLVTQQAQLMIEAAKAPQATYERTRADWQASVLNDPDIKAASSGGKVGIDAVKVDIGRALTALGDIKLASDFKAAMDLTGAGDHPAFVKAFWKLSQLVGEGRHVSGAGPSPAKALYPGLPG
jgi:hypothetical protein